MGGWSVMLMVMLGGAVGALGRYFVSVGVQAVTAGTFPYGTLIVNVTGSFAIGLLYILIVEMDVGLVHFRAPLMIGVLGAFTTFSAFSLETLHLIEGDEIVKAGANVLANVCLCLVACWAGLSLGRWQL